MKLHLTRKQTLERGQAMVEFAVLMIVFIPLLMWSWYFMDVGHHMLDLQETVLSTTWDYTSRTNQHGSNDSATLNSVYHANRFEYIDHTSAFDHFDDLGSSSDEKKYHYEIGARAAWVNKNGAGADDVSIGQYASDYDSAGARQVVCANDHEADLQWITGGSLNPVYAFGDSDLNKSGLMTCWAKLSIYNYVIPEKFMQEHAHVDLTDRKLNQRSSDVETLTDAAKPLVLKDHAAISFGTWAINDGEDGDLPSQSNNDDGDIDYCPKAKNPFYERVATVFTGGYGGNPITLTFADVGARAGVFAAKAASSKLAIILPIPPIPGTTDGSPEGFSCPTIAGFEAIAGRPANPIGVNLVARHHRDTGDRGEQSPITFDIGAQFGPKYESYPFEQGGGKFKDAWDARGKYYMGHTSSADSSQ